MSQGAIPDESPRNLLEQLLLQDALAGNGKGIQGGVNNTLGDAPRLVAIYGGSPEHWYKMSSVQFFLINGASVQVHWFRNRQSQENVEYKFKRQHPKIAPKNL